MGECKRCVELEGKLSDIVLKHGGTNAGYAYGPANCSSCGQLSYNYYLVGQGQLCLECHGQFPAQIAERDRLREQLATAREALEWYARGEHYALEDWESASGEPESWLNPPTDDPWQVEDGTVARQALAALDAGKDGSE